MKFHKNYVSEEEQHPKLCPKPWIYQALHRPVKRPSNSIRYNCQKMKTDREESAADREDLEIDELS